MLKEIVANASSSHPDRRLAEAHRPHSSGTVPFRFEGTQRAAALPRASGVTEAGSFKVEDSVRLSPQTPVGMQCVPCNLQMFLVVFTDRLITRVAHSSYGARGSLASTYSLSPRVQH